MNPDNKTTNINPSNSNIEAVPESASTEPSRSINNTNIEIKPSDSTQAKGVINPFGDPSTEIPSQNTATEIPVASTPIDKVNDFSNIPNPKEIPVSQTKDIPVSPPKEVTSSPKTTSSWQNQPKQASDEAPAQETNTGALKQIRTYQGDVANAIEGQDESLYSLQQAEKAKQGIVEEKKTDPEKSKWRALALVVGSFVLVGVGVGLGAYSYLEYERKSALPEQIKADNIFIPPAETIEKIATNLTRSDIINLIAEVQKTEIALGEVIHIQLLESKEPLETLHAQDLFTKLEFRSEGSLIRALDESFMIGVLKESEPQVDLNIFELAANTATTTSTTSESSTSTASTTIETLPPRLPSTSTFIIFKLTSFENAFAGMLEWEQYMLRDLGPLFSTRELAANTGGEALFEDVVLRNKDARVLRDPNGKEVIIYSFMDQNTLIITDNGETLKTIISRLNSASLSR